MKMWKYRIFVNDYAHIAGIIIAKNIGEAEKMLATEKENAIFRYEEIAEIEITELDITKSQLIDFNYFE